MNGIGKHFRNRNGQAIVFFVMVVVILSFVVLWNFDVHRILHVKSRTQNAGDAAALMAARWQGITLNLIGDLNVMNALALSAGDTQTSAAIGNLQARLCLAGPMIACLAAQQAAKNNAVYAHPDFSARMRAHARAVRRDYGRATGPEGQPLFEPPYPGAWADYAAMLDTIASDGVAAAPDNTQLYTDREHGHLLLSIDFYDAVAGRSWCWFYHHAPGLLEAYRNFFPCWWPPLPEIQRREPVNSELFGLGLTRWNATLEGIVEPDILNTLAAERGLEGSLTNGAAVETVWYGYATNRWTRWTAMSTDGPDRLPLTGPVRARYDYAGADAAVRIEAYATRLTPGRRGATATNSVTWTAAAKPFGFLENDARPNAYGLVLPAFREVRLIPVDACSMPSGGAYNIAWREHIEHHLEDYLIDGPGGRPDCWFCRQLIVWEDEQFRAEGARWLTENNWRCTLATPGGPGRGGGTRRGH